MAQHSTGYTLHANDLTCEFYAIFITNNQGGKEFQSEILAKVWFYQHHDFAPCHCRM